MTVAKVQMPEKGIFICRVAEEGAFMPGDSCVVELDYGRDIGRVLEVFALPEADIAAGWTPSFRVLREEGRADRAKMAENAAMAEMASRDFMASASHERGRVKMLYARFSLDRARLFFRYTAQIAVDLRRFQKQIERDYKTHIDLWQVGVRDEVALMGCVGICGRPVCCATWLRQCPAVNARMAREQEMSMNPVSLNGCCSRLKCCLRFESDQYRDAGARLPATGSSVVGKTAAGLEVEGYIVARDIMRGFLKVRTRDGRELQLAASGIASVKESAPHERSGRQGNPADEGSGNEDTYR